MFDPRCAHLPPCRACTPEGCWENPGGSEAIWSGNCLDGAEMEDLYGKFVRIISTNWEYQCYHWYINATIDISMLSLILYHDIYIYIDILIYPNRNEWFLERNRGLVWELWEINKNHQTQNSMGIICRKCWIDGISAEYHQHQVFFYRGGGTFGGLPCTTMILVSCVCEQVCGGLVIAVFWIFFKYIQCSLMGFDKYWCNEPLALWIWSLISNIKVIYSPNEISDSITVNKSGEKNWRRRDTTTSRQLHRT